MANGQVGQAPQGSAGPQQGSAAEGLATIAQALVNLREGAAQALPAEAVQALDQSIASFQKFLEITGGQQPEGQPRPVTGADANVGQSGARPAEF